MRTSSFTWCCTVFWYKEYRCSPIFWVHTKKNMVDYQFWLKEDPFSMMWDCVTGVCIWQWRPPSFSRTLPSLSGLHFRLTYKSNRSFPELQNVKFYSEKIVKSTFVALAWSWVFMGIHTCSSFARYENFAFLGENEIHMTYIFFQKIHSLFTDDVRD